MPEVSIYLNENTAEIFNLSQAVDGVEIGKAAEKKDGRECRITNVLLLIFMNT